MSGRMKTLDDSKNEFVSNVSHELKTPLTSMKVLADSLNGQEGVPVELYQEFMQDITSEIDRENQIITDLLSLVKMDKKVADLNITQVNINELLEQLLKRLHPIAAQKNVELILDSFRPVNAEVDATKLSLAFSNLIENGIKYNNENGWVRVSLNADHKYFYVTVADSGIGIPEEELRHAAELSVCKINIDSDLRLTMTGTIRKFFEEHPDKFDPREYLKPARANIKDLVRHKLIHVLGCAGKA